VANETILNVSTHLKATILNNQGQVTDNMDYYITQNQWITRSLFIGNILYTISNVEMKLNNLSDMSQNYRNNPQINSIFYIFIA
jgi:hypothetical protein